MNLIDEARALHELHDHVHSCGLHDRTPKSKRPDLKAMRDDEHAIAEIQRAIADADALFAVAPEGWSHPYIAHYRERVAKLKLELPAIIDAMLAAADARAAEIERAATEARTKLGAEASGAALLADARKRELAAEADAKRPKRAAP